MEAIRYDGLEMPPDGKRGAKVPRGMLSAVRVARRVEIDPVHSGRLEFARWLTDPSHR